MEINNVLKLIHIVIESISYRNKRALTLTFEDIKDQYLILYANKSKNSDGVHRKVEIPDCIKGLTGEERVFPEWNDTPKFLDKHCREIK